MSDDIEKKIGKFCYKWEQLMCDSWQTLSQIVAQEAEDSVFGKFSLIFMSALKFELTKCN